MFTRLHISCNALTDVLKVPVSYPDRGKRFFSSKRLDRPRDSPSLLFSGYRELFFVPFVKRPGHEADHSLLISAGVKNNWSSTFIPRMRLYGLFGYNGNFTMTP